jgi:2,3-bisphosphoglycerate-independent phosphoglycerate mutase
MTIGSGRIIFQSLEKINKSIKDGDFFKIPEFLGAIENCKKHNTHLHLIGLLQVEGVHSHKDHLFALLDLCKQQDFKDVYAHVITDGRDSPVTESLKHVKSLLDKFKQIGFGKIATISGRYYSMDRDNRWDRTKLAYDCIVDSECEDEFDNPLIEIGECHKRGETDEFIKPRKAMGFNGIKEHDSIIYFNFRTDRTRQLTKAIIEENFEGWERKPLNVHYVAMTQFYNPMNAKVAFKDQSFDNLLGMVIGENGLKQLRISETEKYAHVTFFFNGQVEKPNIGEDRILINSPKVATYDLQPEMSVYQVTQKLVEEINTKKYDVIVTNLVNGDMVGHTGIVDAILKAVRAVDDCVGKIVDAGLKNDYSLLIFADHGNAEDQTPEWRTSHTLNPVPFILVSEDAKLKKVKLKEGKGLEDIAPTVLDLIGIAKPKEMTGESLILR